MRLLVKNGVDINAANIDNNTALIAAIYLGKYWKVVEPVWKNNNFNKSGLLSHYLANFVPAFADFENFMKVLENLNIGVYILVYMWPVSLYLMHVSWFCCRIFSRVWVCVLCVRCSFSVVRRLSLSLLIADDESNWREMHFKCLIWWWT